MKFGCTKINRNNALTEREDLVLWQRKHISNIRQEGRPIYFLDETWVNVEDCSSKVWIDTTVLSSRDAFLKVSTT